MFDAATREECVARRARSNTPLAALVLLNDPSRLEASRALATRILRRGGATLRERLQFAAACVLSRSLEPPEFAILARLLEDNLRHYRQQRDDALQLLQVGMLPVEDELDASEVAAWMAVARSLLSTHEAITRM